MLEDDECGALDGMRELARKAEVLGGKLPQCHFVTINST
jgi:hypothetical protein